MQVVLTLQILYRVDHWFLCDIILIKFKPKDCSLLTFSDALFLGLSHNALLGSSSWHGGLGRLRRGCNAGKKKNMGVTSKCVHSHSKEGIPISHYAKEDRYMLMVMVTLGSLVSLYMLSAKNSFCRNLFLVLFGL